MRARNDHFILCCFPGVGRSRAAYRSWAPHLPPGAELIPLELPTHGYDDELSLHERAVELLRRRLADALDGRDIAVFGHSFGALAAYELARAMEESGGAPQLFVAGSGAPHTRSTPSPDLEAALDDDTVTARLLALGDQSLPLRDPDVRAALLPKIRADLRLADDYRCGPMPGLVAPVWAFGGADDPLVRPAELAAWSQTTAGPAEHRVLPGGHFFVEEQVPELCRTITAHMRAGPGDATRPAANPRGRADRCAPVSRWRDTVPPVWRRSVGEHRHPPGD